MSDSSTILWECELLRTRQWLARNYGEKRHERDLLFQCVKAHIGYKDHQHSMLIETLSSDDDDDVALEFLGELDAADMRMLLQAEAAKTTVSAPNVEAAMPEERSIPSAGDLILPLEMPCDLVSPELKPTVKPVPISQLDLKVSGSLTTMTSSAMLGSESAVHALMHDLHVEVSTLQHSDGEECKTEESTPPYLIQRFGANGKADGSGMSVDADSKSEQCKYMLHMSSTSPRDPHKKKAATRDSGRMELDEHATEMLSWVSGYRDPDVIRRKENMRRKRKHTHRYGVTSEEEQLQVQLQIKKITRDSESDSEDDVSSDYLPAEDEEVPEQEDHEVVDLLSDDYLDSDEDKRPAKRNRKRLRLVTTTPVKCLQKPSIMLQKDPSKTSSLLAQVLDSHSSYSDEREDGDTSATIRVASIERGNNSSGESKFFIELKSSTNDLRSSDTSRPQNKVGGHLSGSHSSAKDTAESEVRMESTISQSETPEHDDQIPEQANQKELFLPMTVSTTTSTIDNMFSQPASAIRSKACGKLNSLTSKIDAVVQSAGASDADAKIFDTRTASFDRKDLSTITQDNIIGETSAAHGVLVGDSAEELKVDETQEILAKDTVEIQLCSQADKDDDSEAETLILDDEESIVDDRGLDCSDTSESGFEMLSDENNTPRDPSDATGSKKDESAGEMKISFERDRDNDAKDKVVIGFKSGGKLDASKIGVEQFFDHTPLKLKYNSRKKNFTALKLLPVHTCAETQVKKAQSDCETNTNDQEKLTNIRPNPAKPAKSTIGSNGLRPCKKPIATTTITKGKYAVTRRSTKMLDVESTLNVNRRLYDQVSNRVSIDTTKNLDDVPLNILAREMANKREEKPQVRYLSYAGAKKTEDTLSHARKAPRIVSKSRLGGGGGPEDLSVASIGPHDKNGVRTVYSREPQISIYDALHVDGHESSHDIRIGTSYKRSNRFKKMQEEAARSGTPMIKGRLREIDLDKIPIPKKKRKGLSPITLTPLQTTGKHEGMANSKRQKKSSKKSSGLSYYGPQAAQSAKLDSISRKNQSWEHSNSDDRRRNRSSLVQYKERDRHDRRDDRRRRKSSRSRSRSLSSRGRDYKSSSQHRDRSCSKSKSRKRSSERNIRRLGRNSRGQDRTYGSAGSDSSTKIKLTEPSGLSDISQIGKAGDNDSCGKLQKFTHSTNMVATPDAVAAFDDIDNTFISDSDDEDIVLIRDTEDIRFDLDTVSVDEFLISRQVYVTGVNPTVYAEQIEEDFAAFGVAVDRETGFPAINIFPCQRNHLGRGDACVTFNTEKGALEAVEELNAKNIKNSMICVRRMDAHTQRILTVQFQLVRDTWRCTGTQCRADVSIWNAKCDKCGRKRVYGPSNIKIKTDSWLCSLCLTANDSFSTSCHGCMETLPEVDRSTFYTS